MNSVVVLQARTTSSRLPGKVLLPINGMPLVVLAAKRAANTGRRVIVATSMQDSDDGLAALLAHYDIPCFRGSLENTLDRVVEALSAFDDQTIVFRLGRSLMKWKGTSWGEDWSTCAATGSRRVCRTA